MRLVLVTAALAALATAAAWGEPSFASVDRAIFPDGAAVGEGWALRSVEPTKADRDGYGICGRRAYDVEGAPGLRARYAREPVLLDANVSGARTPAEALAWAATHRGAHRGCGPSFLYVSGDERLPTTVEVVDGTYPGVTCERFAVANPGRPFRASACRVVTGRVVVTTSGLSDDENVDVVAIAARLADTLRRRAGAG